MGGPADLGIIIALIGVLSGVGVVFAAFAGAYLFGKSRGQQQTLKTARDPELVERLARVEQIVEATAIEIERISEGQRFTTKLLGEKKAVET
jgi:high-affinity K+ transport system ATPase subunit B